MGSRRRNRRQRPNDAAPAAKGTSTKAPATTARPAKARPAWRETFDQWGGVYILVPAIVVVVVLGALVWMNRPGASVGGGEFTPLERTAVEGRIEGDPNAPVRIIEFADFSCPHCGSFASNTHPTLLEEYIETGQATLEFRHAAFMGDESIRAAEAAECAMDQGAFWEMHDLLFLRQGNPNTGVFSESNLKSFAREIAEHRSDFDTAAFDSCLSSGEKRAVVTEMTQQAQASGVTSTPTFFVNGEMVSGAQPITVFRDLIDRHVAR